jgi:Uma2 family endonuclease
VTTTVKKLTYADYEKIPADRFRHEIVGGEEWSTPTPYLNHQAAVGGLLSLLGGYVSSRKLGQVFVAPTDVLLSEHDIVQPDVLFISAQRASILTEANIQGAPDLVVEVLSPWSVSMDRGPKLALYERSGVAEYWIVDPPSKMVEIREFGATRRTRVYKEGQSFESALLPGLVVKLSDVFAT